VINHGDLNQAYSVRWSINNNINNIRCNHTTVCCCHTASAKQARSILTKIRQIRWVTSIMSFKKYDFLYIVPQHISVLVKNSSMAIRVFYFMYNRNNITLHYRNKELCHNVTHSLWPTQYDPWNELSAKTKSSKNLLVVHPSSYFLQLAIGYATKN